MNWRRSERQVIRRLGERFGEWDDRSGLYHLGGERKGCVYHRIVDCCPLCFVRFAVYQTQLAWELRSRDPYPDAQTQGVESEDRVADEWIDGHGIKVPVQGIERNGTDERDTDGGAE